MKKATALVFCLILMLSVSALAMGGSAPSPKKAAYPYLIDNFEDGVFNKDPEWFVFDNLVPTIEKNNTLSGGDPQVLAGLGEYSLKLSGAATNWYVGGMGLVMGIDASGYGSFEMDVYGYGEGSGKLKVELYDDDNGNSDIEVDKNWKPTSDDLFVHEIDVNWSGWKHLSVPFSQFKIEGNGNKVFDPNLKNGSGGLVKIQLITVAPAQTGAIKFNVDNLELGVSK